VSIVLELYGAVPYSLIMTTTGTQTLYRAADTDYVGQGTSFAESRETAAFYLDNPGFGGASIWTTEIDADPDRILDLRGVSISDAADLLGLDDPCAIGVDEWIPQVAEYVLAAGYDWALVDESYPEQTTTWIWCGDCCDDPDLEPAD